MTRSVGAWRLVPFAWSGALFGLFGAMWVALADLPSLFGAFDFAVVADLHRFAVEPFVEKARELTLLGGTQWLVGLTVACAALLAALRYRREAVALALAVASTEVGVAVVKHLVVRERPPAAEAVDHAAGFSFPSGHAAASVALFASVAFLVSREQPRRVRVAVWSAMALLLLGIGLTRVYLGVHYPTDVAAGWLLGGALTTAAWALCFGRAPVRFSLADLWRGLSFRSVASRLDA